MNNSRNFTNEISNKNSFVSLKEEINKKIKETLFDQNLLFLSSSFNEFCSTYNSGSLLDEAKNISNLIDNLPGINEEEKIENISLPPCNPNTKPQEGTEMEDASDSKKKFSESEEEKSSSFGSKFSKFSQVEENKQKLNICLVKFPDLIKLLDVKNGTNEENNDLGNNNENDKCDEKLRSKISQMENDLENNKNIEIKNRYLRKMVCLKLYKALHFALKNFSLDEEQIKHICLYIEIQGRISDISMGPKYKEFIETILKRISADKMISN